MDPNGEFIEQYNDETNSVSQSGINPELEVNSSVPEDYEKLKGDDRIYVMKTYVVNPNDDTDRYFLY